MKSSDQNRPKSGHGLLWLVGVLVALFALYSAGWFWTANRLKTETAGLIAALASKGVQADCANMAVAGYPLRLAVTCDSLAYQDDARAVAASAGSVDAAASLFVPLWPSADFRGPLRTVAPGMTPLWIDWDGLRATTALWWPLPSRLTLAAEGLSGQTDPEDGDPVQLFSAGNAEAEFRPVGGDLAYSGRVSDLEIDAEAIGGRQVPPLDASGDATIKNGLALLRTGTRSLRGQSIDIGKLQLSSGEARVTLSGPLSVDEQGLIDARLEIRLRNPKAVGEVLGGVIPERKSQIEQGFAALAMLGGGALPLTVVKGKASLGFIPLGRIGPVR